MTLIRALLSGDEMFRIEKRRPANRRLTFRFLTPEPVLELIDSAEKTRAYDLSSAYAEGMRIAELVLQVNPTFAVEADCRLGEERLPSDDDLLEGRGRGIRFQPFYLPECAGNPEELVGRGLFFRGFHFSGRITPSFISLLCVCDVCAKSFRLQSFHAGFGNQAYFYCSEAPHTLVVSSYEDGAPPALGEPDFEALARLEAKLPACGQCGGRFAYFHPLRCPHCRKPYIDFPSHREDRYAEYYGNVLYGEAAQEWASGPGPGSPP